MLAARLTALLGGVLALVACAPMAPYGPGPGTAGQPAPVIVPADPPRVVIAPPSPDFPRDARGTARAFVTVLRDMEPQVERECMARRSGPINCDFQFVVVDDPEINAFQELDNRGRPVIGFTLALIANARNADELAFVIGHEASHHILQHISQKSASAQQGAILFGVLASASGADQAAIVEAQRLGQDFGARYYSKEWELQADYLGAIITASAGFDPMHGAQFFMRLPDPGDRILGSHPARGARLAAVSRAMADLADGRAR